MAWQRKRKYVKLLKRQALSRFTLQIPYSEIKSVEVLEDMLNYQIAISTDSGTIRLSTQQKELSEFRAAGALTFYSEGLKMSSWHKENLDATLEALRNLNQ